MAELIGTIYVIAAPSGGGKTSLVNALLGVMDNIKVSVSYTTRAQRPGEQNDLNYHFVDHETFQQMSSQGVFLEQALVHGHYYGTSRHWVEEQLAAGIDVILEIDWQGARQIRLFYPQQSTSIFILPPSLAILASRLTARRQDAEHVIEQRLAMAGSEMAHCDEFDYWVVNDVFEHALLDLQAIIRANRLRRPVQSIRHARLLAELLSSTE